MPLLGSAFSLVVLILCYLATQGMHLRGITAMFATSVNQSFSSPVRLVSVSSLEKSLFFGWDNVDGFVYVWQIRGGRMDREWLIEFVDSDGKLRFDPPFSFLVLLYGPRVESNPAVA